MNIPNYIDTKIISAGGMWSDEWKFIMQQLIQQLQLNASNEGLVAPTQNATNMTTIQNHQNPNGDYTTQYGTILYNSTDNTIRIAVNNGSGAPIFKKVTLT